MSNHVNNGYCNLPTVVLNSKPSFNGVLEVIDNVGEEAMCVGADFAKIMLVHRKNQVYIASEITKDMTEFVKPQPLKRTRHPNS